MRDEGRGKTASFGIKYFRPKKGNICVDEEELKLGKDALFKRKWKSMKANTAQIQCPSCQCKRANKVPMNSHYCMECGVEFNADTFEIFAIAFDGSLKRVAKGEPIENLVG
ncbi:MAG: hypothetical protein P4L35_00595 [Ignavibacteriaceae bacterium]|nr:hypothetical protein [Ignavibacteriaceae bacterium]